MDNGWQASAHAWIANMSAHGDFSRRYVLDPVMLPRALAHGAGDRGGGILSPAVGIAAFSSDFLTITANTLGRNGNGINLLEVLSSTISGNDASGNSTGIQITNQNGALGSQANIVSHNILNGNGGGLNIDIGPVTVQNNLISGNAGSGIIVSAPGPSTAAISVTNNRSLANGAFDLVYAVLNCTGTVWSGNTFFTANQSCIH